MQYMVELEHRAESCIAGDPAGNHARLFAQLKDYAADKGLQIQGGWLFPVGHRMWFVVDAENGHDVQQLFFDAKVHLWSAISVNPVNDYDSFLANILLPAQQGDSKE